MGKAQCSHVEYLMVAVMISAATTGVGCGYTKLATQPPRHPEPLDHYTIQIEPSSRPIPIYDDTTEINSEYIILGPREKVEANRVDNEEAVQLALHQAEARGADALSNLQFSTIRQRWMDAGDRHVTRVDGFLIKFRDQLIVADSIPLTIELPVLGDNQITLITLEGRVISEEDCKLRSSFVLHPVDLEEGIYGVRVSSGHRERSASGGSSVTGTTLFYQTTIWVEVKRSQVGE